MNIQKLVWGNLIYTIKLVAVITHHPKKPFYFNLFIKNEPYFCLYIFCFIYISVSTVICMQDKCLILVLSLQPERHVFDGKLLTGILSQNLTSILKCILNLLIPSNNGLVPCYIWCQGASELWGSSSLNEKATQLGFPSRPLQIHSLCFGNTPFPNTPVSSVLAPSRCFPATQSIIWWALPLSSGHYYNRTFPGNGLQMLVRTPVCWPIVLLTHRAPGAHLSNLRV